jgi:deazaflavin-dependent oxidoreductase (nitroreductase family)
MWFMNHLFNPLVLLILKSRLHGMISASLLVLTCRGRKSGRVYRIPVQYAQEGKTLFIVPGAAEQKTWWRNLSGGARVQLILRGQALAGQAEVLRGEKDERAIAEGLKRYFPRFPGAARMHKVQAVPDGTYSAEDLHRAALSVVMVRVELD